MITKDIDKIIENKEKFLNEFLDEISEIRVSIKEVLESKNKRISKKLLSFKESQDEYLNYVVLTQPIDKLKRIDPKSYTSVHYFYSLFNPDKKVSKEIEKALRKFRKKTEVDSTSIDELLTEVYRHNLSADFLLKIYEHSLKTKLFYLKIASENIDLLDFFIDKKEKIERSVIRLEKHINFLIRQKSYLNWTEKALEETITSHIQIFSALAKESIRSFMLLKEYAKDAPNLNKYIISKVSQKLFKKKRRIYY